MSRDYLADLKEWAARQGSSKSFLLGMDRLGEQTSEEYKAQLAEETPCVMVPAYTDTNTDTNADTETDEEKDNTDAVGGEGAGDSGSSSDNEDIGSDNEGTDIGSSSGVNSDSDCE